jgi:hypothetical protein
VLAASTISSASPPTLSRNPYAHLPVPRQFHSVCSPALERNTQHQPCCLQTTPFRIIHFPLPLNRKRRQEENQSSYDQKNPYTNTDRDPRFRTRSQPIRSVVLARSQSVRRYGRRSNAASPSTPRARLRSHRSGRCRVLRHKHPNKQHAGNRLHTIIIPHRRRWRRQRSVQEIQLGGHYSGRLSGCCSSAARSCGSSNGLHVPARDLMLRLRDQPSPTASGNAEYARQVLSSLPGVVPGARISFSLRRRMESSVRARLRVRPCS